MVQIQSVIPQETSLKAKTIKYQPTTFIGKEQTATSTFLSLAQIPSETFKAYNLSFKGNVNVDEYDNKNEMIPLEVSTLTLEGLRDLDDELTAQLKKLGIKGYKKEVNPSPGRVFEKFNKYTLVKFAIDFNEKVKPENFNVVMNELKSNNNSETETEPTPDTKNLDSLEKVINKGLKVTIIPDKLEKVIDKDKITLSHEKIAELSEKLTIKNPKEVTLGEIYEKVDLLQREMTQVIAEATGTKASPDSNAAFETVNKLFLTCAAIEHNNSFNPEYLQKMAKEFNIPIDNENIKKAVELSKKYGIKDTKTVDLAELYSKKGKLELITEAGRLSVPTAQNAVEQMGEMNNNLIKELETKLNIKNAGQAPMNELFQKINKSDFIPANQLTVDKIKDAKEFLLSIAKDIKLDPKKNSLTAIIKQTKKDLEASDVLSQEKDFIKPIIADIEGTIPKAAKKYGIDIEKTSLTELFKRLKKACESDTTKVELFSDDTLALLTLMDTNLEHTANILKKDINKVTLKEVFENITDTMLANARDFAIKKDPEKVNEGELFEVKNIVALKAMAGELGMFDKATKYTLSDIYKELSKLRKEPNQNPKSSEMMDYIY